MTSVKERALEPLKAAGVVLTRKLARRKLPTSASDAVTVSFSILERYAPTLAGTTPTILRVDGGISLYQRDWLGYSEWRLMYSVGDALNLGVSG